MSETAVAEPPATPKPGKESNRDYVVLEQAAGTGTWKEIKVVKAGSSESAIRALAASLKDGGAYVAVPMRNWKPVKPKIETKTTVSLRFD